MGSRSRKRGRLDATGRALRDDSAAPVALGAPAPTAPDTRQRISPPADEAAAPRGRYARGRARVGGLGDRADDGDPPRPGGDDLRDVARVDPADREERHRRVEGREAHELDADRVAAGLRRRRVDRADADVVGVAGVGDLFGEVRRLPDERIPSRPRARRGGLHVVLPDMAAVGAGLPDELGVVVEDQQRAGLVAQPARDRGRGEQLVAAGLLVAQLHDVDARGERRREHVGERATAGAPVADEV